MDIFKKTTLITLLFSASTVTGMAGTVTSTVDYVQVNAGSNRAYIQFNSVPANRPACATDPRMTIDLTTQDGKSLFNMALTAKASGKTLYAAGTNTCVSKYEKVSYMRLL